MSQTHYPLSTHLSHEHEQQELGHVEFARGRVHALRPKDFELGVVDLSAQIGGHLGSTNGSEYMMTDDGSVGISWTSLGVCM